MKLEDELLKKESIKVFLEKTIDDKFDLLYSKYNNKKIAIDTLKQLILETACFEVCAKAVCDNSITPATSIILISSLFSIIPIKSIIDNNKQIDSLEMIIPGLQEAYVNSIDDINKLKYNKVSINNKELIKYSENDIQYEYSSSKRSIKVKIK